MDVFSAPVRVGEEAREGEVEGALKSTSVVSACRIRYRRTQNEAVRSSLALIFIVRLFLELELPMSIGLFFSSSALSKSETVVAFLTRSTSED